MKTKSRLTEIRIGMKLVDLYQTCYFQINVQIMIGDVIGLSLFYNAYILYCCKNRY